MMEPDFHLGVEVYTLDNSREWATMSPGQRCLQDLLFHCRTAQLLPVISIAVFSCGYHNGSCQRGKETDTGKVG